MRARASVCVCVCVCVSDVCERVFRLTGSLDALEECGIGHGQNGSLKTPRLAYSRSRVSQQRRIADADVARRACIREARDAMRVIGDRRSRMFGRDWEHSTPILVLRPARIVAAATDCRERLTEAENALSQGSCRCRWYRGSQSRTLNGGRIRFTPHCGSV